MLHHAKSGYVAPLIFPEMITHCETGSVGWEAISAGFVRIEIDNSDLFVSCFDHSESMKGLAPGPQDEQIIADWLEFGTSGALAAQSGLDVRALLRTNEQESSPSCYDKKFDLITQVVADKWGIRVDEILGKARTQPIAIARYAAMYFCRKLTPASLYIVGAFFHRDHGTVAHAEVQIENRMKTEANFALKMADTLQSIMQYREFLKNP